MDSPDDFILLASGTHPSSTEFDAKELASGTHFSGTEPYNNDGGSPPPPPPDGGDSSLDDGECCPFSPMIDGVDEEEDKLCGASSWSLHTDCLSLRTEMGGGAVTIIAALTTMKMTSGRGATTTADATTPPLDADENGMTLLSNGLSLIRSS